MLKCNHQLYVLLLQVPKCILHKTRSGKSSYFLFAAPLLELARDESVQTKVLDVARQFFSNSNITINLLPALIAAGLLLLLLPLLFLFLAPADDGGASGYGAPAAEYGAPSSSYGAPSSSYGYRSVSILFIFQYEVIRVCCLLRLSTLITCQANICSRLIWSHEKRF